MRAAPRVLTARELLEANRLYYDSLWSDALLVEPERFNTWPLVESLLPRSGASLEVAPGLRPRLPIDRTWFVDLSRAAASKLQERGARIAMGLVTALPFADATFDLVAALDIVEHVDDDRTALGEISRVARPGAVVLISLPLRAELWNAFDEFVGHRRRYEPAQLPELLGQHGLHIERSAVYGMQPRSSRLLDVGIWFFENQHERALWWYNRVFLPLGLKLQKKLAFASGLAAAEHADEVLMVCRKTPVSER
jgi:SAM-dependent methyltransferase